MDLALFRLLNSLTGNGWDWLFIFCASYLQYVLIVALIITSIWPIRRTKLFIASLGAAIIARIGLKTVILLFVHRARPFVSLADVRTIIGTGASEQYQSFPSGHAIFFFALATAAYRFDRRLGSWLFAGATVMGIARVISGVHWPSDILAGAVLGSAIGWAVVQYIPSLRRPFVRAE